MIHFCSKHAKIIQGLVASIFLFWLILNFVDYQRSSGNLYRLRYAVFAFFFLLQITHLFVNSKTTQWLLTSSYLVVFTYLIVNYIHDILLLEPFEKNRNYYYLVMIIFKTLVFDLLILINHLPIKSKNVQQHYSYE